MGSWAPKRLRYAIHPGRARHVDGSLSDDPREYSFDELVAMYRVDPRRCVPWDERDPATFTGRDRHAYRHLFPRVDGRHVPPLLDDGVGYPSPSSAVNFDPERVRPEIEAAVALVRRRQDPNA